MDERKLKNQLFRIAAIMIISSILLCVAGGSVLYYLLKTAHESDNLQMRIETEEYKDRILKQLDSNMQILSTLSRAYEVSQVFDDPDQLADSLALSNEGNDFISMVYMSVDGVGILNTRGYGTWEGFTLEDCNPYSREAIEQSFQGEDAISKMFDSQVADEKVFVYSVPVWRNGDVIGALAASDSIGIFTDIADGNTVMGGEGYVHLINETGSFLVRSKNTLVKEDIDSIFDGPYMDEYVKENTRQALINQESVYGQFKYEGQECHFYTIPLGLNGWHLFCVNRVWGSATAVLNVMIVIGVVLMILVVANGLLYYGFYIFKKRTNELLNMAYYDRVTGAENSLRFDQEYAEASKKNNFSVAALNIHNFKAVNDLFGNSGGNKVLCYVKKVIEQHLKEGEFFCRDAADLFYIYLLETQEDILLERVGQIINYVRESSSNAAYSYEISIYAGIVVGGTRENALVALQSIRGMRHKNIAFYNNALHQALRDKNDIESGMYIALKNQEFKLFLQPKNDLRTGQVVGAEALVRWQKADGSYRYPNEFIPLFEANGFCTKLDIYMVEQACRQIREWIDAGNEPIPISINQSKLLFSNRSYVSELEEVVDRYGVAHDLITLEILEGVAMNDMELLISQIQLLHEKGFRVSLDDFGTGYSSLNMLYQLKIDELKLDRGFLRKASNGDAARRQIILEQVIGFAKKLGISTVAEGVETEEDRRNMEALSCDIGQGYFYDKPIAAQVFTEKYMHNRA